MQLEAKNAVDDVDLDISKASPNEDPSKPFRGS